MGLILDSSVVIAGERHGRTVRQILEQFKAARGEIEMGLSVVTIWNWFTASNAHQMSSAGRDVRHS